MRVAHPSVVVKVHHFSESLKSTVVHVWSSPSDLSQCRCLERADIFRLTGYGIAAEIDVSRLPPHSEIVVLLVSVVGASVASHTATLASKHEEPALCGGRESGRISLIIESVYGTVAGEDRPLKVGEGDRNALCGYIRAEGFTKQAAVARDRTDHGE